MWHQDEVIALYTGSGGPSGEITSVLSQMRRVVDRHTILSSPGIPRIAQAVAERFFATEFDATVQGTRPVAFRSPDLMPRLAGGFPALASPPLRDRVRALCLAGCSAGWMLGMGTVAAAELDLDASRVSGLTEQLLWEEWLKTVNANVAGIEEAFEKKGAPAIWMNEIGDCLGHAVAREAGDASLMAANESPTPRQRQFMLVMTYYVLSGGALSFSIQRLLRRDAAAQSSRPAPAAPSAPAKLEHLWTYWKMHYDWRISICPRCACMQIEKPDGSVLYKPRSTFAWNPFQKMLAVAPACFRHPKSTFNG